MPNFYNPLYYQQQQYYPQQMQQQYPQQQQVVQQSQPQQIQNGGFVAVRGEGEARNYPVAPGTSITFKDETAPYIYTKTMGFSQLDRPIFDKYRLVREEETNTQEEPIKHEPDDLMEMKQHIQSLTEELEALRGDVDVLKEQTKKPGNRKKDDNTGGGD